MRYLITRYDKKKDEIAGQTFEEFDDAYKLLKEINSDLFFSNKDQSEHPYYEIVEINTSANEPTLCLHCNRTASNGIKCLGMCVADNEY